jgi:hypothetical protein
MDNSKDYFVANIVTNEEMQCNGYMDFLCRNMKEQISNGILAIVSDGNEYAIKMLPEQRIKKPDMLSVEIRQGISVKELVRCRECENWDTEYSSGRKSLGNFRCICQEWSNAEDGFYRYTAEDDYCSYGERKGDGTTVD